MITPIITCEHAGNRVPPRYRRLFLGAEGVLASHRGWDPGALEVGRALSRSLGAPYVLTRTTRLLVDPNRTRDDRGRFSEFTRELPRAERDRILADHYEGHWKAVAERIPSSGRVLHVASHSFTPVLHGRARDYEVGLLYDPRRSAEAAFVRLWRALLLERWWAVGDSHARPGAKGWSGPRGSGDPEVGRVSAGARAPGAGRTPGRSRCPAGLDRPSELRVRLNLPYRGWSDGMTTALRSRYGKRYLGIELECNQGFLPLRDGDRLRTALAASLVDAVAVVSGRKPRK